MIGRIPQHAIITPVAWPSEVRKRHQFQRGDAAGDQMIELADHGKVAAFFGEGADVGFDLDGFMPRAATPVRGAPLIGPVIDHFARTRNIVGLKGGSRIGYVDFVVDPEFVACAGLDAGYIGRKPAVFAAPHRLRPFQQQVDALRRRRPKPEGRAIRYQSGAELPLIHAEPANARTERGGAVISLPDAWSMAVCLTSAVFNSCCQFLYSGIFGSLNAIAAGAAFSTMKTGAAPCSIGPRT